MSEKSRLIRSILIILAFFGARVVMEEVLADDQVQYRIPEEFHPFIGRAGVMLVLEVRTVQECVHERAVLPDAIIDPPFELPEAFPENGVGIIGGDRRGSVRPICSSLKPNCAAAHWVAAQTPNSAVSSTITICPIKTPVACK